MGNNEDFYEHVAARPFPQEWLDKDPDRFQRAWFARVTKEMEQALGPGAGEVAQDRWMYAKATAAMKSQPRLFLRACVLRAIRFWNVVPLRPARGAVSMVVLVGLCAAFSIELGLFLIGLGGLWWRRDAGWMLLFLFIASFAGVHLFYWSNMRMRAPVVPLLALFGARGVRCLFGCAQLQLQGHSGASGLSPQNSWRQ